MKEETMPNLDELYKLVCRDCNLKQEQPVPADIAEWSSDFHLDRFPGHTVVCTRAADGGLHWTATKRKRVSEPLQMPGKPGAPATKRRPEPITNDAAD